MLSQNIIVINIGIKNALRTADKIIPVELIDPVVAPYSSALDVPMACDAFPNAIPLPNSL